MSPCIIEPLVDVTGLPPGFYMMIPYDSNHKQNFLKPKSISDVSQNIQKQSNIVCRQTSTNQVCGQLTWVLTFGILRVQIDAIQTTGVRPSRWLCPLPSSKVLVRRPLLPSGYSRPKATPQLHRTVPLLPLVIRCDQKIQSQNRGA